MSILVTGAAGYIGSVCSEVLTSRGMSVIALDSLLEGHRAAVPADRLIVGDLNKIHKLDHLFVTHRIEAVVHFAAYAFVGESVTNPGKYYQNNLVNTLNLMECMRRNGVKKMVFSSTCATYGIPQTVPITEEEPQKPINPYGNGNPYGPDPANGA